MPGEEISNPTVFAGRTRKKTQWIIFFAVAAIVVLAVIMAWRFFVTSGQNQAEVAMLFDVPDTVTVGSETEITIVYENHESKRVFDLSLELTYPSGFQFITASQQSADDSGRFFTLSELSPNASGSMKIYGIFAGVPSSTQTIRARLVYSVSGISSQFTASASTNLQLQAANFDLRLTGPTSQTNGQRIEYLVAFQNISDSAIDNLYVKLSPPSGFVFEKKNDTEEPARYEVGRLTPGDKYELNVAGFLSGSPGDRKIMRADLLSKTDNGEEVVQGRAVLTTVISQAELGVSHKLSKGSTIVSPGEDLEYEIAYSNDANRGLRNVVIRFEFEDSIFDLSTLRAEGGALVGRSVVWNASGVPDLEVLQPGAKGKVSLHIKVRTDLVSRRIVNPSGMTSVFASSLEFPNEVPGDKLTVKVKSALTPTASLFHLTGPEPPTPGQTTEYRVLLSLSNTVNQVGGIVWLGFVNSPTAEVVADSIEPKEIVDSLTFNFSSGRISWDIGNLTPFSDVSISFVIRLNPSVADLNKSLQVFRSTELTGKDEFTNQTTTVDHSPELKTVSVK